MIDTGLKDYERNVVEPRHRETQSTLKGIIYLLLTALGGLAVNLIVQVTKHS